MTSLFYSSTTFVLLFIVIVLFIVILVYIYKSKSKKATKILSKNTETIEVLDSTAPSIAKDDPYFWDTGRTGERYTREALAYLEGEKQFLSNCYIPKDDGTFTEIDLILIHESGIYVLESKNYSGWIFGSENQKQWVQSLPSGKGHSKKVSFLNPIIQNKVHLKWLRKYLDISSDIPIYSYIVFSDRCELKEISLTTNEHTVINRRNLFRKVILNADFVGHKCSCAYIYTLYKKLYPLTQVTEEQKAQHIKSIEEKKRPEQRAFSGPKPKPASSVSLTSNTVTETVRKCPRCGGDLVLRTAKRGGQAGRQFWGCSNYPKCRFIENIDSSSM